MEGVRLRYSKWLQLDKRAVLKLRSFGISRKRIFAIAHGPKLPSLMEALAIDCATAGACSVYDWADTEWMESIAHERVNSESEYLFHQPKPWPVQYTDEQLRSLRQRLITRLSLSNNAFKVTATLGNSAIVKSNRRAIAQQISKLPVTVEDDATEQEINRAIARRERLRYRQRAYVNGARSTVES